LLEAHHGAAMEFRQCIKTHLILSSRSARMLLMLLLVTGVPPLVPQGRHTTGKVSRHRRSHFF
jgi:hypothetical protein